MFVILSNENNDDGTLAIGIFKTYLQIDTTRYEHR